MSSSVVTMTLEAVEDSTPLPALPIRPLRNIRGDINTKVDIEMNSMPSKNQELGSGGSRSNFSQGGRSLDGRISEREPPRPASEQVQSIWNPYKIRFRVLAACFAGLANGMNDAAPGALIASIEKDYNIGYGTVSTIFVCNALGFTAAAFFTGSLSQRIGRAKALMISEALLILGYTILVITPPFPVVAISFFVLGMGMAINLAINQVFCANLANNTALVGLYQGSYEIGGIVAPLIATSLISKGRVWSQFYFIELGLAAFNLLFSGWAFWNNEHETDPNWHASTAPEAITRFRETEEPRGIFRKWSSFKNLTSNKPTLLGALFIFAYQGAEVAISGWIISSRSSSETEIQVELDT